MSKHRILIAASILAVAGLAAGSAYPAAPGSNPPPAVSAAPAPAGSGMMNQSTGMGGAMPNGGMAPSMMNGGMMPMMSMMTAMAQMATQGAHMMKTCNDVMQNRLKSPANPGQHPTGTVPGLEEKS